MNLSLYYKIKPLIPRKYQISLRRWLAKHKRRKYQETWPIDPDAGGTPENWPGWPDNKKFGLVLNHDVDTQRGHDHVLDLIGLEKELGFRSAFSFVPERYQLSRSLIDQVKREGFEVCVHGLKHDGKLFESRETFDKRAVHINQYIEDWEIDGFTAPAMLCQLDWVHGLDVTHSTCTFDTDPFEPNPNAISTIFPFQHADPHNGNVILELPYTLAQDHGLFIILQEKDISIWKQKVAWIVERGGMVLVNTHPDYMNFSGGELALEEYPVSYYLDLLKHIRSEYEGLYYHALPSELSVVMRSCLVPVGPPGVVNSTDS